MSINYDKPLICERCGGRVEVSLPIWVTPGDEDVDVGEIDYEATPRSTYCEQCQESDPVTLPQDEDDRSPAAALIEAAPELLDACKKLLAISEPDEWAAYEPEEQEVFKAARAAIAKAQGKL